MHTFLYAFIGVIFFFADTRALFHAKFNGNNIYNLDKVSNVIKLFNFLFVLH